MLPVAYKLETILGEYVKELLKIPIANKTVERISDISEDLSDQLINKLNASLTKILRAISSDKFSKETNERGAISVLIIRDVMY
jgi:hypothetical protein